MTSSGARRADRRAGFRASFALVYLCGACVQAQGNAARRQADSQNLPTGQPVNPKRDRKNIADIVAGRFHTCLLTTDGTVTCWGGAPWENFGPRTGARLLSSGELDVCALFDERIECWLASTVATPSSYGELSLPIANASEVSQISGYMRCGCALRRDGRPFCWGASRRPSNDPHDLAFGQCSPPSLSFASISIGYRKGCGVTSNKSLACWGLVGGAHHKEVAGATEVAIGMGHTCVLLQSGAISCWIDHGRPVGGRDQQVDDPPSGTFTQLSAGFNHTCGLRSDRSVACWGANDFGQATAPAGKFKRIAAGYTHSCGVTDTNMVRCWGGDPYGGASWLTRVPPEFAVDPPPPIDLEAINKDTRKSVKNWWRRATRWLSDGNPIETFDKLPLDGWGRTLRMRVAPGNLVIVYSLGYDGREGGVGEDEDFVRCIRLVCDNAAHCALSKEVLQPGPSCRL